MNDYVHKILLLGDTRVGKSAILLKYHNNEFMENMAPTIGIDFKTKQLKIGENNVRLQIWDTAGQERFQTISLSYYRNVHAAIIVFDLSNYNSFANIPKWISNVNKYCGENVYKILVGSKSDSIKKEILNIEIEEFVKSNKLKYLETSALTGENINKLFYEISKYL